MKEIFGVLLAAVLAGCQTVPPHELTSDAHPAKAPDLEIEQRASGFTAQATRREVTCPASCRVTMAPNSIMPLVYDGSGVNGPQPGWPGPPDAPDSPTPSHDDPPIGYKFCEFYVLTGDLYLCGKPPKCPGPIFSAKYQQLLEVTVTTFGAVCDTKQFKPHVVKPIPNLTLVAGTEFAPISPPSQEGSPTAPKHPRVTLQVREHILNADLVTVDFPQVLRVDEQGYLVGSLALFSAPTKITVVLRGSNPKGMVELPFTINLVPAKKEEEQ